MFVVLKKMKNIIWLKYCNMNHWFIALSIYIPFRHRKHRFLELYSSCINSETGNSHYSLNQIES